MNACVIEREVERVLFLFQDLLSKYLVERESNQYKFPQKVNLLVADSHL
ncbi:MULTISPECIES: hypothetical protein [unclassified Microcoleus]|nr:MULTISPECIES: hypothetical protein [unclassified Microcoleus]